MVPDYPALSACVGRSIEWRIGRIRAHPGGAQEIAFPVSINNAGGSFVIDGAGRGGIWIPYVPHTATYAYATAGAIWAGTGPFSGCKFEVGINRGSFYAAHIAVEEGGLDSTAALDKALPDRKPIKTFRPTGVKIGAMMGQGFEGLMFVVWAGVGNIDATQIIYDRSDPAQKIVNATRVRL